MPRAAYELRDTGALALAASTADLARLHEALRPSCPGCLIADAPNPA